MGGGGGSGSGVRVGNVWGLKVGYWVKDEMDICFVGGVLSRVLAGKIGVARVVCEGRGNRSRVAQSQHPSDDNTSPGDLLEEINLLKRENEILRRQREASEEKNEEVAEVELGEIGEGGREISFTYLEEGNQPRVLPFLGVLSDISKDTLIAAPQLSEIEDPHWLNVLESFPGWNGAVVAVPGLAQVSTKPHLNRLGRNQWTQYLSYLHIFVRFLREKDFP